MLFRSLFNPALGDYLLARYHEDENILYEVFRALNTNDSLDNIKSLHDNSVIDEAIVKAVLSRLLSYYLSRNDHNYSSYIVKLVFLTITNIHLNPAVTEKLKSWFVHLVFDLINPSDVGILFDSIKLAMNQKVVSQTDLKLDALFESLLTNDLDHDDYASIDKLLVNLADEYRDEYMPKLKRLIIDYWEDMIDQDIANSGKLDEFLYDEEEESAINVLSDHVTDLLSEFSIEFDDDDIDAICESCDVWSHIESNRENAAIPDEHREHGRVGEYSSVSEDVAIENLFDRT